MRVIRRAIGRGTRSRLTGSFRRARLAGMIGHDESYMRIALHLAQAAGRSGEAPVGAVLVDPATREVVVGAHNAPIVRCDPTAHAEIAALRIAGALRRNYRLTGLWLYATLEPCAMCAGAISHARVGRLVFAASDPKGGAVLHGPRLFEQPTCHWRPEVAHGVLSDESATLLRAFFRGRRGASPG